MSKRSTKFVLALVALVALTGCSHTNSSKNSSNNVSTPVYSDADISSGCWTAAQRDRTSEGDSGVAGQMQWKEPPAMTLDPNKSYTATIETSAGNLEVEFYPKDAPKTVNNFVCLAKAGYYDNTPFHRIIKGFVIQGGDPTGTGTGGPGYRFNDEPISKDYLKGTLAMANAGKNTNGSQFFVVTADLRNKLPKSYTIFGQVTDGMDVVDKLENSPVTVSNSGEQSKPVNPVTLNKVTIHET
jgi:cyclophilin family peptidyl-prolyl cis-trans isomerase